MDVIIDPLSPDSYQDDENELMDVDDLDIIDQDRLKDNLPGLDRYTEGKVPVLRVGTTAAWLKHERYVKEQAEAVFIWPEGFSGPMGVFSYEQTVPITDKLRKYGWNSNFNKDCKD